MANLVLDVKGLTKSFGARVLLEDVSFTIQEPRFAEGASVMEACCAGFACDEVKRMTERQYLTVLGITDFE